MKNFCLILFVLLGFTNVYSQKDYTVNGVSYQLKTAVDGELTLLWNIIDNNYRYFVKKDESVQELLNTKNSEGNYQKEYIDLLNQLTDNSVTNPSDIRLTLPSLKKFINEYNASVDSSFSYSDNKLKLNTRLGVFGGITNNPFIDNPDNATSGLFGAELEFFDDNIAKRHAAFFQLTHVLESDELQYSSTEISIGYRFRFIYTESFNMHANLKLVTLTFSNSTITTEDEDMMPITQEKSATSFDAPVIFGLGADFKVGKNGFITLYYNELFSVSLENQGNFSTNIALGYKFTL